MRSISLTQLSVFMIAGYLACGTLSATELIKITPENYDAIVPGGKETDAILGDWVLRNDKMVAVIAQPLPGRKANMTVRGVSGMLIDFTRRYFESDQLSCFYPASGRYLFEDAAQYHCEVDGVASQSLSADRYTGSTISLVLSGTPLAADGTTAQITYTLHKDRDWIEYRVVLTNNSKAVRWKSIYNGQRRGRSTIFRG